MNDCNASKSAPYNARGMLGPRRMSARRLRSILSASINCVQPFNRKGAGDMSSASSNKQKPAADAGHSTKTGAAGRGHQQLIGSELNRHELLALERRKQSAKPGHFQELSGTRRRAHRLLPESCRRPPGHRASKSRPWPSVAGTIPKVPDTPSVGRL